MSFTTSKNFNILYCYSCGIGEILTLGMVIVLHRALTTSTSYCCVSHVLLNPRGIIHLGPTVDVWSYNDSFLADRKNSVSLSGKECLFLICSVLPYGLVVGLVAVTIK